MSCSNRSSDSTRRNGDLMRLSPARIAAHEIPEEPAIYSEKLAEVGDFFVEVGESGFEGFAVVGMSGGGEIVGDAGA